VLAIRRHQAALASSIELETVEGTGYAITFNCTQAQGCAAMRAEFAQAVHLAVRIAPEDKFLAHPGDSDRLAGLNFS
jgi:hypothetical protein